MLKSMSKYLVEISQRIICFLSPSMMNSQKDMPVIVGNFFIDSLNKYLKNLSQEEFETLDETIQNVYFATIEAI